MNWNDHSKLVGLHAFLGASKYHWINYDAARLAETYASYQAKKMAQDCTHLRQSVLLLVRSCRKAKRRSTPTSTMPSASV